MKTMHRQTEHYSWRHNYQRCKMVTTSGKFITFLSDRHDRIHQLNRSLIFLHRERPTAPRRHRRVCRMRKNFRWCRSVGCHVTIGNSVTFHQRTVSPSLSATPPCARCREENSAWISSYLLMTLRYRTCSTPDVALPAPAVA